MTTSGNQSTGSQSAIGDRAHHMAGTVVDKVQETASRLVGANQDGDAPGGGQTPPITERATEQVTSRLDAGKEYVVDAVTGLAQALRQTGQHLREDGAQPMLAQYADRGAEQIEHVGGYLRRRDTTQLMSDAEDFARRKPIAFASGAFALGMLAVRFLRSSNQSQVQPSSAASAAGAGSTGSGTTPRPASTPGAYTAGYQSDQIRTPQPLPTSTPASSPSTGGRPATPGSAASAPQTGGAAGSERPGAGIRNQP